MYFNRACNSSCLTIVWFKWMLLFSMMFGVWKIQGVKAKKAALDQVREGLMVLEEEFGKCSKCMDFFGRDWIGYVDIALGSLLGWLNVMEKMNGCKAT